MLILIKFIVKILLSFAVVIMLSASVKAQTPVLDLPELQEWYSWPGALSSHISYLPNFSAQGDAITQYRKGEPTWFNRFPYDTTNQFSWKELGSVFVVSVDFNNDGIQDYMDTRGRIYTSSNKGEMPNPEPVKTLSRGGFLWASTGDFNGDGFEDIFAPNTTKDFEIIFGGQNLSEVHRTISTLSNSTSFVSTYINENGKARLISYYASDYTEGFYLYEINFSATPNDSIIVGLKQLDKIEQIKKVKTDHIFEPSVISFYQSKIKKDYSLFVFVNSLTEYHSYAIENDIFRLVTTKFIGGDPNAALSGSIDGDSIEDYVLNNIFYFGSEKKRGYYVISGNPIKDTTKRAVFYLPENVLWGQPQYIGDVTGDGIGDLAYGEIGQFIIYKGVDWRKLSVTNEVEKIDFTLQQTEPNPIGADGKAVLPATLAHSGNYTLEVYNLTGKRLGELFSGDLPSGEIRLPFDVQMLNLSSGLYELRLSDGKHSREHAYVISR